MSRPTACGLRLTTHGSRLTIYGLLLTLTTFSCGATSYLWYRLAPDYPRDRSETLAIEGLSDPVEIYLDAYGIPHIEAKNEPDLVRATGFMQARNRFFQMDVLRRIARGRLSELVGEQKLFSGTTVEFDRTMRSWGLEEAALAENGTMTPETKAILEVFAQGVNAGLKRHPPIEYRMLRVEPEPWTTVDSLALGYFNGWTVSHNWHQETSRLLLALHGGIDRAEKIYGSSPWSSGYSLPTSGPPRPLPPAIVDGVRQIFPSRPFSSHGHAPEHAANRFDLSTVFPSAASNSWVVSGNRSFSGKPIVANDPHLVHLLPSILFQQHLTCPGLDVIGATLPGVPYVLTGHNRNVAWGTTSSVADVIDLYIERTVPGDPAQVEGPAGNYALTRQDIDIRVRRGSKLESRRFILRKTRNGPLLNDVYPGLLPEWAPPVSIHWDLSGTSAGLDALRGANRATTVADLYAALLGFPSPPQAWSTADREGRIAFFTTGRIPIRPHHLGTFPVPGWTDRYSSSGALSGESMPFGMDSPEGFFAHGNNLVQDPLRTDGFLQIDSAPSYRAERISELIRQTPRHDRASFAAIHSDVYLIRAKRLLPHFLADLDALRGESTMATAAVDLLHQWDLRATTDSSATTIFFVTYREAIIEALGDEVDERGLEFILSQRYSTNVTDEWVENPDHVVWDHRGTPKIEHRAEVIRAAFRRALLDLSRSQGRDPATWRWGRLHDLNTKHLFGSKRLLAGFFNLPREEAPGALDSVWKAHFDLGQPETPFRDMAGPAYRMIVDLADMDHASWVVDTGASGWPGSPHYGDQRPRWLKGEYLPMMANWVEIRSSATARLSLRPGDSR
ncbi:MAG: penicillin acylase family protein [Nitrospirae bacterium]|nr:penicillin acylase family protein [Nitrospirota bacterium]